LRLSGRFFFITYDFNVAFDLTKTVEMEKAGAGDLVILLLRGQLTVQLCAELTNNM